MNDDIVWKAVKDYEGLYEVNNIGQVRSLFRYKKQLKPNILKNGYATVQLFKNKLGKRMLVHRIVAMAFLENPNQLPQVNHKDENKLNNSVTNLEWISPKDNMNYGTRKYRQLMNTDYSDFERKQIARKNGKHANKAVIQYAIDGSKIQEFVSAAEAQRKMKLKSNHICECCKGKYKTAHGYIWKYKEVC